MKSLIDTDNMRSVYISQEQKDKICKLIDSGSVTDFDGRCFLSIDRIDCGGDICVDEVMYKELKERVGL